MKDTMTRTHLRLSLAFTLALTACEPKDTTAPPPPVVDPIVTPTALTKISVTGSAEFGATVSISGAAAAVKTKADAFTARWRADVTLTPDVATTLSVTATDAAGNVSEPTVIMVSQASARATRLKLSLTAPVAKAGELVGLVTRVFDQYGNEMPDEKVSFATTPSLAPTFTIPNSAPAVTKDQGVLSGTSQFVAYDVSSVQASNFAFQIKATAGAATDTQVLTVRPASGQRFSKLAFVPSGTSLSVKAGEAASYTYEVVDLYGNVTTGPVSAFTNAPGAVVIDDGVSGAGKVSRLTTVGTYTVSFYLAGVGQKGALDLNVSTAPAAFVDVGVSATLASPQTPVKAFARVRDTFGNAVLCSAATTADLIFTALGTNVGAVTAGATTCFNGAFQSSFTFAAEDNYAITATYQPAGAATNVSGSAYITVFNFDNTPPQVALKNITVNGIACDPTLRLSQAGCDVSNGDTVDFDVLATDNSALAQVAYSIFFSSTQVNRTRTVFIAANSATATVHFRFTVNSTIETTPLVALAVDRAGNIMNSTAVNFFVNLGAPVGNRTLAAVINGGLLNRPNDIAFDNAGNLFILNRGTNEILKVASGAQAAQVYALGVQSEFIVHGNTAAGERMWLSDRNSNNGVVRVFDPTAAAPPSLFSTVGGGNGVSSGLAVMGPTPARGLVDVSSAADGDQLRLAQNGVTISYQFQNVIACVATSTVFCVPISGSATGAQKAAALAAAVTGNTNSVVTASSTNARVFLATKATGEPTATTVVSLSKSPLSSGIVLSTPQMVEGHDLDVWSANDGDNNVRRYLSSGGPFASGTNHGSFNVGTTQWGLAVRDVWAAPSDALFDSISYLVDSGNFQTLRAYRTVVSGNGVSTTTATSALFSVNSTTVGIPTIAFNGLWDTALTPNGCLLVSDNQGGNVFAVDVRAALSTTPAVERVARNLVDPRGLAIDSAGNLLIADGQDNAVLKLTPTPDPTDCF